LSEKQPELDANLIKALGHPVRVRILEVMQGGSEKSNKELSAAVGETVSLTAYHVKVLEEAKCIQLVRLHPVGGSEAKYYRIIPGALFGGRRWKGIPPSLRRSVSGAAIESFLNRAIDSLEDGKFDTKDSTALDCFTIVTDQVGRAQVFDTLGELSTRLEDIHKQSLQRLKALEESGSAMFIGISGFELADEPDDNCEELDDRPSA